MDAAGWDERYRSAELVWGAPPNRFVVAELDDVAPGVAVDLACGEGRNAHWLAARGWQVTGVDFSRVAIEKARQLAPLPGLQFRCADAIDYRPETPVDLALLCYLQLPAPQRRAAVRNAAAMLAPGGAVLVVAHALRNLTDGVGGPQDAGVLCTPAQLVDDLDGTGLQVERAEEVLREVDGSDRPAIDLIVRARRSRTDFDREGR